jgi:hypothetical protein
VAAPEGVPLVRDKPGVSLGLKAMSSGSQLSLVGCSLDASGQLARLADWFELLGQAASREETSEGVRYSFAATAVDEKRIRALAVAEQRCCSFLHFDVARIDDRIEMAVTAPADRLDALRLIFSGLSLGEASSQRSSAGTTPGG